MLSAAKSSPLARSPSGALTPQPTPELSHIQESREEGRLRLVPPGPCAARSTPRCQIGEQSMTIATKKEQAGRTKVQSGSAPRLPPGWQGPPSVKLTPAGGCILAQQPCEKAPSQNLPSFQALGLHRCSESPCQHSSAASQTSTVSHTTVQRSL